ncbi:MAG: hypothetical protein LBR65_05425 [Culturomica sp.]|jgi:hypothetical protein|nr:hypothetical protein [Culturomica sp.]
MDLNGKWRYREQYGYGMAEGELTLEQEDGKLFGRVIFTDKTEDGKVSMIQEFLEGEVEGRKVWLEAREFDVIHSDFKMEYELDSWFGVLVEPSVIKGVSIDGQGVEGYFLFEKIS